MLSSLKGSVRSNNLLVCLSCNEPRRWFLSFDATSLRRSMGLSRSRTISSSTTTRSNGWGLEPAHHTTGAQFRFFSQEEKGSEFPSSSSSSPLASTSSTFTSRRVERNKKLVRLGEQQKWRDMLSTWEQESEEYGNINYANTLTQLKKIHSFDKTDPTFAKFMEELATHIEDRGMYWIGERQLANIAHALGKMGLRRPSSQRIMDFIAQENSARKLLTFTASHNGVALTQAASNTCWSMAKLGDVKNLVAFTDILEENAGNIVKEGNPQHLGVIAWSCGKLKVPRPKFFAELDGRAGWFVKTGCSQSVANTAWAGARLNHPLPNLFAEIDNHSDAFIRSAEARHLSNIAWACAKQVENSHRRRPHRLPKFFAEIEKNAAWFVSVGNAQNVSNMAWSCAKLNIQAPNLFHEIEEQSAMLFETGLPLNVATTVWAFAKLDFPETKLYGAMMTTKYSKWLIKNATSHDIRQIDFACHKMGRKTPFR